MIELAKLKAWAMASITLDYVKCLDLVPEAIVMEAALGAGAAGWSMQNHQGDLPPAAQGVPHLRRSRILLCSNKRNFARPSVLSNIGVGVSVAVVLAVDGLPHAAEH